MKINALDRPARLPARIAAALMNEITEGRLRPGDRLPTEQYLADSFGVSRNVVREAIAQLRSAGVVHSRQGLGTVVSTERADKGIGFELEGSAQAMSAQYVYELRMGLEPQGATMAALRGTQAQFDLISRTLERLEEAERWDADGVDIDIEFHLAVADASGNPLFREAITFLTGKMRETIVATRERSGDVIGEVKRLTIDEHRAIRDAIVSRNPVGARRAVAMHIVLAAHRLGYDLTEESAGLALRNTDRT